ncbi:MAG TPA: hypothetical protein VN493_05085 [Thermoanaerobaculia bacterium]|nr:hypothetical protein [Thermoanaerobaculia bacterium]
MTQAVLPDAVKHFLTDDIVSVERLDVLLFLYRHAKRWWAAQKLSAELEMPADAVQSHLEHLSARNLLEVRIAESVIFCYKPVNEELSQLVEAVASTHYHHRDAVVSVLTDRQPTEGARLFAEAFHFWKGRRNG